MVLKSASSHPKISYYFLFSLENRQTDRQTDQTTYRHLQTGQTDRQTDQSTYRHLQTGQTHRQTDRSKHI